MFESLFVEPAGLLMSPRFLRPAHIIPTTESVWLVDPIRPAAAVVAAGRDPTLVTWPGDKVEDSHSRLVVANADAVVVQDGSTVRWIGLDSSSARTIDAGRICDADGDDVWLADNGCVDIGDLRGAGPHPPPPLEPGWITVLSRDGSTRRIEAPAPVRHVRVAGEDVIVTLAELPIAHPHDYGCSYEYPLSTVRFARDQLFAGFVERGTIVSAHDQVDLAGRTADSVSWCWLEEGPEAIGPQALLAGGVLWSAGALPGGDRIDRHVIVRANDPDDLRELLRLDLGVGLVVRGRAIGDELWIAVARRRFTGVGPDGGVEVVALSSDGSIRTVLAGNSIDIASTAPDLVDIPADEVATHIERERAKFEHLDAFWRAQDGKMHPLTCGLTDPAVDVRGQWPHVEVVVTLRHVSRPGLLLRRTFPIFDEDGSPWRLEYADIEIMEDLDTGYVPPASEALGGVLDF